MSRTAEEAMLVAAMEGDQETLDRLAEDSLPSERDYLREALDRVHDALDRASTDSGEAEA